MASHGMVNRELFPTIVVMRYIVKCPVISCGHRASCLFVRIVSLIGAVSFTDARKVEEEFLVGLVKPRTT